MMDYLVERKNYLIFVFTVVYLAAFTINAIFHQNYEFLYYTVLLVALIYIITTIHHRLHLGFFIIINLSVLGFLHLLGGNLYFGHLRLYDFYIIAGVIRYDNIIHTYATFIATLGLYSLIEPFIDVSLKKRYYAFALVLILMAIGLGTINELVELFAVLLFDVSEKVGGYFNNALDLLFNTLGATAATVVIYYYNYRPKFIRRIDGQTN
ncbi:MAG: hypothetical protein HUU49_03425 [Candidatus Buchananbacteria bacterium]|nr:hypothetical protein [Candidatus Buchananbacteria bacterium]